MIAPNDIIIIEKGFISDGIVLKKYISSGNKRILKIDVIRTDTFDKKNNFFSARRSLKKKINDYGRNISIIMIN